MNDDQLSSLLAKADETPVDENAKKRAINAALSEFTAANMKQKNKKSFSQGFLSRLRLISRSHLDDRRNEMKSANKKYVFGGLAGAAVSMFAWVVFVGNPAPIQTDGRELPSEVVELQELAEESDPQNQSAPSKGEGASVAVKAQPRSQPEISDSAVVPEIKEIPAEIAPPMPEAEIAAEVEVFADSVATTAKRKIAPSFSNKGALSSLASKARPIDIPRPAPGYVESGRDQFQHIEENNVKLTSEQPISTFSVDVDTASYSFMRSALNRGVLPQKDAVRIEEMLNYFDYAYPLPKSKSQPFQPTVAVMNSPWAKGKKLIHIGIKGYDVPQQAARKTNLVFLLDVSGSMNAPDKLPLVKQSMSMLLNSLNPSDKVAIVVYAGAAGTVLEPTLVKEKQKILDAMKKLQAGGSTAGGEGIKLAYQLAEANFDKTAVNRIILATDGDFNVGIRDREELKGFVERKREKGIFLSLLGFGEGNYNDHMMQVLAQNGNGVAAYIDTLGEAQKILVNEASSTLFPIAKDVKIQFEFNPVTVAEYRLIGYETRRLNREDFNNDKVDAGDIGAGHSVTAIYEVTPTNSGGKLVDDRRYGSSPAMSGSADEYGFLKIRYKLPSSDESQLITQVVATGNSFANLSKLLQRELSFASSVAGFAQLLRGGKYIQGWTYEDAIALAQSNKGADEFGYRTEFVQLIRRAQVAAAM